VTKRPPRPGHLIAALLLAGLIWAPATAARAQDSGEVKSLRGEAGILEALPPPGVERQNTTRGQLGRAYRQQPPLIPHRIAGYQITTKVNKCMSCHDWPNSVKEGAPKISETHYVDRNGIALDRVARTRWFCSQCHVPQANTRALIENDFKSAADVE
jgi:cytochrome c-type protein NapB